MGLIVEVYRGAREYDCTNHGISSMYNELCLVNVDGPFEPSATVPAAILDSHYPGCLRIVPAMKTALGWVPYNEQPMFGGNLGYTSDSRFPEACEKLLGHTFYGAVKIHDRFEVEQERIV